ncbi:pumilio/PUF RNA binding protein 2 [Trypanosoma theileri]|uniref:Pumilio/PUF RNA binding protein 2 n=1 Tax=Trypanosoma theileri TaxID=67003 RepID=A0A1X0P7B3_9TRYP|nr:pumilio/PUF RNA binding protein 2 [Trypanosoma theileri]ORC92735.1 pumilio/PUF RNA binding protein 2 [Trypanosoma theileri]
MSDWDNFSPVAMTGESRDGAAPVADVDWLAGGVDIFSGGANALLVNPRDVRRAETAPSVLTMFSADGTLCVGGSLEEEVPPEEEYRYTEEYHNLYYSKFPRDPRMLVPLRSRAGQKRSVETSLPGRGITTANKTSYENAEGVTNTAATTITNSGNTNTKTNASTSTVTPVLTTNYVNNETLKDAGENGVAFAQSVLESLAKNQQKQGENRTPPSSSIDTCQVSSNLPAENISSNATPMGSFLQDQMDKKTRSGGGSSYQDDSTIHVGRQNGTPSSRVPRGGTRSFQNGSAKNSTRRQGNGSDGNNNRSLKDEFPWLREYLDGGRTDFSFDDIKGHVVTLSKDQDGSRFIQRLLEDDRNVEPIFNEVLHSTCELMVDVFGNYVLQKLLDVLPVDSDMSKQLMANVTGRLKEFSFQMYGCRVIQRFLERGSQQTREEILHELRDSLVDCVFDQNANHVAQKIIEVMPDKAQFVTEDFLPRLQSLSRHPYGCRVLQCVFEKCSSATEVDIRPLLEAVLEHLHEYVMDQYGNYVVQHGLLNAPEDLRKRFVDLLIPHVYALSCSKFASNVAEKTIVKANNEELQRIVETLTRPLGSTEDGNYLVLMMQDPYANYVVQRLLQQINKDQQRHIAEQTKPHIMNIRRSVYGQHLVQKMESMGMFTFGEGELYNIPVYREYNTVNRGGGKKNRGMMGGRGGVHSRSSPQNNYLAAAERPPVTGNPYQQAPVSISVAGRAALPLSSAPGYSYRYMDSPSDVVLSPLQQQDQTHQQQQQQPPPPQQQQVIPGPSLTVGGQPCYPTMMPQQQRQPYAFQGQYSPYTAVDTTAQQQQQQQQQQQPLQMNKTNEVYTTNTIYANGNGFMNHVQGDGWTQSYPAFSTPMQQPMLYNGNSPNVYPAVNTGTLHGRYNPVGAPPPLPMQ